MRPLSRRRFLQSTLAAASAAWIPASVHSQVLGGSDQELVIAQCCDPQLGFKTRKLPGREDYQGDVARLRLMVDKINGIKPDLVVWCGDMVQAASWDQTDMLDQLKRLKVPYLIAPGNHDIPEPMTRTRLDLYAKSYGKDFSFVDVKGWKILALNTQRWRKVEDPEFPLQQNAFIDQQFKRAAESGMPVLVATHIPPYTADVDEADGYSNISKPFRKVWLDQCVDNNVKICLAGHTHKMCRNEYRGMSILNGEVTCIPLDDRPTGFRLLRINRASQGHRVQTATPGETQPSARSTSVASRPADFRWDFVPVVLE